MINHEFKLNNKGFSNSSELSALPRHRWYYYKEGFSPSLVDFAIKSIDFDKKSDVIFDPFNGSGTVTLFSSLAGYKSIGHEVNPFSSFISNCKQLALTKKDISNFNFHRKYLLNNVNKECKSPLLNFSTFSKTDSRDKWLFNESVLNSFYGGYSFLKDIKSSSIRDIFKLALLNSVMENCNAKKDGKCLRYRTSWQNINYNKHSFIDSLNKSLDVYFQDLLISDIQVNAKITNGDSRELTKNKDLSFKLCITSPPYLNSFDYSDVYRPELFLGEFIKNQGEFNSLKRRTLRSHITFDSRGLPKHSFGRIYDNTINAIKENHSQLWNNKIPLMIQCYFEDLTILLQNLKDRSKKGAEVWIVIANSAYANVEIPTDLIIGEIGAKNGWFLKEIGVLRYLNKRGTKYSPDVKNLRESVIIFSKEKF